MSLHVRASLQNICDQHWNTSPCHIFVLFPISPDLTVLTFRTIRTNTGLCGNTLCCNVELPTSNYGSCTCSWQLRWCDALHTSCAILCLHCFWTVLAVPVSRGSQGYPNALSLATMTCVCCNRTYVFAVSSTTVIRNGANNIQSQFWVKVVGNALQ